MSTRKSKSGPTTKKKVNLPRVPIGNRPNSVQDAFWLQKGHAGSINAFRQLSHSTRKGGRKTVALPGGKLQPLFKNHSAPSKQELEKAFGPRALPSISPVQDGGSPVKRVVRGACDNLPDESPTTVRIYLASGYEDMKDERNAIYKYAVPRLQEFCSQRGLLFHLVDMHWGMAPELQAELGLDTGAREQEIADCQAQSLGPPFIALLGDRYGPCHYVREIPEEEFEVLHFTATEEVLDNSELLAQYYYRNHNAIQPCYVLQVRDEVKELEDLGVLLRQTAKLAYEAGKLPRKRYAAYHLSGLARDVTQGIFNTKDPRSHCLAYHREFLHLNKQIASDAVDAYIDLVTEEDGAVTVNDELQTLNRRLREEVAQHLGPGACRQYFLSWFQEGRAGPEDEEYAAYLRRLCEDVVRDVQERVLQAADKHGLPGAGGRADGLYQAVLHHARLCQRHGEGFEGQEGLLARVERHLRDPRRNTRPFIVHGARGTGKTALMARLAARVREWFTTDAVTVVRFLGTDAGSQTLYRTVVSVTAQICQAYGLKPPAPAAATLYQTLRTFRATVEQVSREHAYVHPLFILLDGLDQLQGHDESLRSMWAIRDLPCNVYMVLSTAPQVGATNLLGALTALVSAEDCTGETEPPSRQVALRIIGHQGDRRRRKLTDDQKDKLVETVAGVSSNQHLYLRHLAAYAYESWESYTVGEKLQLFESPAARFLEAVDALEDRLGPNIVMFIVSYVTVTPVGLHERELLDLLSNNNDVMTEVHKFNVEPPEGVLFFPPGILAHARYALRDFLSWHSYCGRKVMAWNHGVFYVAAAERYRLIYPGITEERVTEEATSFTLMLQEHLANLYLRDDREQMFSESASRSARRQVELLQTPQPVCPENTLKLARLPTHIKVLIPVEGTHRAKSCMLFNLEWLRAKLSSAPAHALLYEVHEVCALVQDLRAQGIMDDEGEDLEILYEFLQLALPALSESAEHLPGEILGRLSGFPQTGVAELVSQAAGEAAALSGDMRLLPLYPCLTPPLEPLRHTLPGPTHVLGFLQEGSAAVMFSQKTGVDIWRVETGELLQRFSVNPEQKAHGVIPGSGSEFVIIGHYSHLDHAQQISVWSSETGVRLVHATFEQNFEYMALNKSDDLLVVVTTIQAPESARIQRCLLAVDVHTKEVLHTLEATGVHEDGITKVHFAELEDGTETVVTFGDRKGKDMGVWSLADAALKHKISLGCVVDFFEHSPRLKRAVCANFREGVIHLVDLESGVVTKTERKPAYRDMVDIYLPRTGAFIIIATPRMGVITYSPVDAPDDDVTIAPPSQFDDDPPIPSKITMDESERYLVVGYTSGLIRVYGMGSGDLLEKLEGHTGRVNSLVVRGDKLFSAADDGVARVWSYLVKVSEETRTDAANPQINAFVSMKNNADRLRTLPAGDEQVWPHAQEDVSCVLVHPDGKRVITSSHTGPIKLWHLETGKLAGLVEDGCEHGVSAMYPAYKNRLLIGHSHLPNTRRALSLKVWTMDTMTPVQWERGAIQVYCSCKFPADDRILALSPSPNNKQAGIVIGIYDLFEMKTINILHCNIFGSMDCTNLKLVGFTQSAPAPPPAEGEQTPEGPGDGDRLYVVLDYFPEPALSFFFTFVIEGESLDGITMETHEPIHLDTLTSDCAVTLPGARCLVGTADGSLLVWDVAAQKVLGHLYDREMLEAVREGNLVLQHPSATGRPAHDGAITAVTLATDPEGVAVAVTGGLTGWIKVWNLATHKMTCSVEAHKSAVTALQVVSGYRAVSGSMDTTVVLSDLVTGARLAAFFSHRPVAGIDCAIPQQRVAVRAGDRNSQLMLLGLSGSGGNQEETTLGGDQSTKH